MDSSPLGAGAPGGSYIELRITVWLSAGVGLKAWRRLQMRILAAVWASTEAELRAWERLVKYFCMESSVLENDFFFTSLSDVRLMGQCELDPILNFRV